MISLEINENDENYTHYFKELSMNISKKPFYIALISLFCVSLQATTNTMRWAAANSAGCFLSGLTALKIMKIYTKAPEETQKSAWGLLIFIPAGVSACYTCYNTGLTAYTLYKKAYAPKKSLSTDTKNVTAQKKLKIEKNTAVDTNSTQKINSL